MNVKSEILGLRGKNCIGIDMRQLTCKEVLGHRFVCVRGRRMSLCGECDEPAGFESWEI